MTSDARVRSVVVLLIVLVAAYEARLEAYIDPGTGSMVLQGMIAAIAGAAVMIRMSWTKIRGLFSRHTDRTR